MRTMESVAGAEQGQNLHQTESEYAEKNKSELTENPEMDSVDRNPVSKGKEKVLEEDGDVEKVEDDEEEGEGEEEDEVADAGRPKLDEGFYEIENVRRRRVRKGVVQYLIKWRDWPETANTWEPVENLQSCSDMIEAFEERLSSGKGGLRRRKRRSGVIHAQIRKKQPRYSGTSTKRRGRPGNVTNSPVTSAHTDDTSVTENPSSSEFNTSLVDNKQSCETDVAVSSEVQLNQDKDCDWNMKLTEFRGGVSNDDMRADDRMMVPSQLENDPQPQEPSRVNNVETTPRNLLITGSKKRKSGKVRRHIPDPNADNRPDDTFDPVPGLEGALVLENSRSPIVPASNHKITEIIKPLTYMPPESSTARGVVVTFLAMRSDGKEVFVDNKYMKAYYPQQLINFYEKNLRYNPIS